MKIMRIPVTDSGVELIDPKQGFIIVGNIFVAQVGEDNQPDGGLIGGKPGSETVLTKDELLDSLGFTLGEVEAWAQKKRNRDRVCIMAPGEEFGRGIYASGEHARDEDMG